MPPRGRKPALAALTAKKKVDTDAVEAEIETDDEEEPESEEDDDDEEDIDHLAGLDEKANTLTKQFDVVVDPATVAAANAKSSSVIEYQTPNEYRITSDCLNYPEFVNLIGIRTTHISAGAVPYVNIDGMSDPREMALKEMMEGKCPFLLKRYITGTSSSTPKIVFELWNPNEMIINDLFYKK
jgi:DNA-directed RNA polymerase I, II, and III subunit RPABC2